MAISGLQRIAKGIPYFVCAWLDGPNRSLAYSDRRLDRMMMRLGSAGVDYIRLMPWPQGLQPYRRDPSGRFDLNLWNKDYFTELSRIAKTAARWRIATYYDLYDHCGLRDKYRELNPWTWNTQNIDGIYDVSVEAMCHYFRWTRKIVETVGLRGYFENKSGRKIRIKPNLFGLGNELTFRGDRKHLHEWANTWGYGHAKHLRSLGYKKEILWSAEHETGQALRAYISPEGNPQGLFRYSGTVEQFHGWVRQADCADTIRNTTRGRKLAYSDDGVHCTSDLHGDGICIKKGNREAFCSASTHSVIRLCRYIKGAVQNKHQFHHIEQLPRSISETYSTPDDLDQHRDVNIYWRIAKSVWNVNAKRTYPQWMYEKYLPGVSL